MYYGELLQISCIARGWYTIVDALWFIWFIGIFEFISGLHEAGMLPVWFLIP